MTDQTAPRAATNGIRTRLRRGAWRAQAMVPGRRPARLDPWNGPGVSAPPVLIGGTGRSGTSVTARLLGLHPVYHALPFEAKFLAAPGGLCDLVEGHTSIMVFESKLLGPWFERTEGRGLHQVTDRATIRAAVRELDGGLAADPVGAARRFSHRLLDAPAVAAGKSGWVEDTPGSLRAAELLGRILPEARFVHLVRDGRDVACSVARRSWGPDNPMDGLRWWARHLDRSLAQAASLPVSRVLTLRMEALFRTDRESSYGRLMAFLDLDDVPAVHAFFDDGAPPDRAHVGRWRRDIPAEDQAAFEALYREVAAPLEARWGYETDLADAAVDLAEPRPA